MFDYGQLLKPYLSLISYPHLEELRNPHAPSFGTSGKCKPYNLPSFRNANLGTTPTHHKTLSQPPSLALSSHFQTSLRALSYSPREALII